MRLYIAIAGWKLATPRIPLSRQCGLISGMPSMKRRWTGKADNESKRCDNFTAFVTIVRRRPKLYRMFQDTFFSLKKTATG